MSPERRQELPSCQRPPRARGTQFGADAMPPFPRPPSLTGSSLSDRVELLDLAPTAGAVVGNDLREDAGHRTIVDRVALPQLDGACGFVVVALVDDAIGVGDDPPVV